MIEPSSSLTDALRAQIEDFIAKAETYRIHSELLFNVPDCSATVDMIRSRDALRAALLARDVTPQQACVGCGFVGPLIGYTFEKKPGPFCGNCWTALHDMFKWLDADEASRDVTPETTQEKPLVLKAALTVTISEDQGAQQADADIAAVKSGSQVLRVSVTEMYFHQLRLRAAREPKIAESIAVVYQKSDGSLHNIGLQFEDELYWPIGFLQGAWEKETEIAGVRRQGFHMRALTPGEVER